MLPIIGYALLACVLAVGGSGVWSYLFHLNLRVAPSFPWSAGVMLALLGACWFAFARTRGFRRPLPVAALRGWAVVAALSLAAGAVALVLIGLRFSHLSPDAFASTVDWRALSVPMRVARVLLTSLTAALFEEAGFRGYLQSAIARRFGVRVSILGTALFFYATHLGHAWAHGDLATNLGVGLPFVSASVLLGMLAERTQSLAPGIVAHTLMDGALLPLEWSLSHNLRAPAIDTHLATCCAVLLASGLVLSLAFLRLKQNAELDRSGAASSVD